MQYSALISRSKSKLSFKLITHLLHSYFTIRPDNQYDTKQHGFRSHSSKTENYFQETEFITGDSLLQVQRIAEIRIKVLHQS
jgi:hypothetical protein